MQNDREYARKTLKHAIIDEISAIAKANVGGPNPLFRSKIMRGLYKIAHFFCPFMQFYEYLCVGKFIPQKKVLKKVLFPEKSKTAY